MGIEERDEVWALLGSLAGLVEKMLVRRRQWGGETGSEHRGAYSEAKGFVPRNPVTTGDFCARLEKDAGKIKDDF